MIEKFFKWICSPGKPIEITLLKKEFSWPDAGNDKCKVCGVVRREHSSALHIFEEGV